MSRGDSITDIIVAYREGASGAFERLLQLVYPELRLIARQQLRRRSRPDAAVLDTTALAHEAYVKLAD